jgi:polysaccharide deacetylase family protein (PEP-CTERM system associated)
MPGALKFAPAVITVDVEDWPQSTWDRTLPVTRRAADNTLHLLDLLADLDARTTMFVLGGLARKFPEVVKRIQSAGHEVACHGDGHVEVFDLSRVAFTEDVKRARDLLEQITGQPVHGYRAPDFSIVRRSLWALEVLAELGFRYDASIFPVSAGRYGIPDWPVQPVQVALPAGARIVEIPVATLRLFGRNWPLGGGGYQRLLPGFLFRLGARQVLARRPFVLYCHPYEFDPSEFAELKLPIPARVRLHQGLGRRFVRRRFTALVRRYGSRRMIDLVDAETWPRYTPAAAEN